MKRLEGIMALTHTPLKEDYSLNEEAVRREIDWVIHPPLLSTACLPVGRGEIGRG